MDKRGIRWKAKDEKMMDWRNTGDWKAYFDNTLMGAESTCKSR
jgi:hypothetical protein